MGVGDKITVASSGYSGTPLAKKLGIKQGFNIRLINAPDSYLDLFSDLPGGLVFVNDDYIEKVDLIHFFTKQSDEYMRLLPGLKKQVKINGVIWASWPKKASKVVTDITEDIIRSYAIKVGLVDIKICAIDETWSGLKLVIPLEER